MATGTKVPWMDKLIGAVLIGIGTMHLLLGENDPLNPLWSALTNSIEIFIIVLGALFFVAPKLAPGR